MSDGDAGRPGVVGEIAELLRADGATSAEKSHATARFFDGLTGDERVTAIRSLGRAQQRSRRTEKVLLDHNQVGHGRTTASIYSVRPVPGAQVSTPLTWDEVEEGKITPDQFTIRNLPDRVASLGDLAAGLNGPGQKLPHL